MKHTLGLETLTDAVREQYPGIRLLPANPKAFCFEERVLMNCFYCKNYNLNWKCPPRIPKIDYQRMMAEYDNGAFVLFEFAVNEDNFSEIRAKSTNDLHHALLALEKYLWEHDRPMAISFIGGSCKLCKNGCGPERCNNPYLARVPFEATGVNVLKTVEEQTGLHLSFPPREKLSRVGLLLW